VTGEYVRILAVEEPDSWDLAYSMAIPLMQSASPTGDPVSIEFPVPYTLTGMSAGSYYIRAFIDEDGSGTFLHTAVAGQHSADPMSVSNRVTGINLELGLDTDEDGIPDWWEMQHFGSATGADAEADDDGDGLTNLQEYEHGTNPNNPDTSGDGLTDSEAIMLGLNPNESYDIHALSPSQVTVSYKHRTAERNKFTQWPAFIQTNPPVYYTRLLYTRSSVKTGIVAGFGMRGGGLT